MPERAWGFKSPFRTPSGLGIFAGRVLPAGRWNPLPSHTLLTERTRSSTCAGHSLRLSGKDETCTSVSVEASLTLVGPGFPDLDRFGDHLDVPAVRWSQLQVPAANPSWAEITARG